MSNIYERTNADKLLREYDEFCATGDKKELLNHFCTAYDGASYQAFHVRGMGFDDVSSIIYKLARGSLDIVDGQVVYNKTEDTHMPDEKNDN